MNPMYIKSEKLIVSNNINDLIDFSHKRLDYISLINFISQTYIYGDRTLIDDIKISPWMAELSEDESSWIYNNDLPKHSELNINERDFARSFYEKLKEEIRNKLVNNQRVGILLSGGMDSRIVAAVLKTLIDEEFQGVNVTALTWGKKNSRDVVYAERIAKLFAWEWKHFEMKPDDLLTNMKICAQKGAIYSPLHLHAMPKIRSFHDVDIILAGSFGDSIGRGEYSGKKVLELQSFHSRPRNKFNLLKRKLFDQHKKLAFSEIERYRSIYPRDKEYQYCELEKQIHYMRKQLNQCMAYINESVPVYQVFTSQSIYELIWSIDPTLRNDKLYLNILNLTKPELLEIPWARTGVKYLSELEEAPDDLDKEHHDYGIWIRNELYDDIKSKVLSRNIKNMNVFNMSSLKTLLKKNKNRLGKATIIDEYLIWVASLSDFIDMYDIKFESEPLEESRIEYIKNSLITYAQFFVFNKKYNFKK